MPLTSLTLSLSLAISTPLFIDDTELCHTANAGFWVKGDRADVLFDAVRRPTAGKNMYKSPSPETLSNIMTSSVPTVALVSHEHWDHFDAKATMEHLKTNPNVHYVITTGAYKLLDTQGVSADILDRIHAIYPKADTPETRTFGDVKIEIYRVSHGAGRPENNGYRVTVDGISFFHTGDINTNRTQLREAGLTNAPVDYLLLPDWFGINDESDKQAVIQTWDIGTIVPMHIYAGGSGRAFNFWDKTLRLTDEMACTVVAPHQQ